MPKFNLGVKVQQRSRLLLQAILAFASDATDQAEPLRPHILISKGESQRLVIHTQIRYLIELVRLCQPSEPLNGEQIKEALKRFEDHVGFLEDHRVATQGAGVWHFTLRLWHPRYEIEANLQAFDRVWNEKRSARSRAIATAIQPASETASPRIRSWGDAVDTAAFHGREAELATLKSWVLQSRCRLIMLLGMGGMGKTALSVQVARQMEEAFDAIVWRSLRNALPLSTLLADLVLTLSSHQLRELPDTIDQQIHLLLDFLRERRCLIILDNVESILKTGTESGRYREGYDAYGQLLRSVAEASHESCLIMTSREKPSSLATREGENLRIRSLQLTGVDQDTAHAILQDKGITVQTEDWLQLVAHYSGNPLALKIAVTTIQDLFEGDITAFLEEGGVVFGDIADLLHQQISRLTSLEMQVMQWLAIAREPLSFTALQQKLMPPPRRRDVLEALSSLQRRSLLEKSDGAFTQQPVVMEYITEQILEQVCDAFCQGEVMGLEAIALSEANAKDYIRQAQYRTILQPAVKRLMNQLGSVQRLQEQGQSLLTTLQRRPPRQPGYSAGNLLNLLHQAGVDLRGWDFSNLALWQVYFPGMRLPQVNLSGTDLERSVFTETVGGILDAAYSPDGQFLATAISQDIVIWDLARRQQRVSCQGHTAWVICVTYAPHQGCLASGSNDATIRLWNGETGQCLRTLWGHQSAVQAIAFSTDGQFLASGSNQGEIRLWDVASGTCLQTFQAHENRVLAVQFCPGSFTLISSGQDGTVNVWDCRTATCLRVFPITVNWNLAMDISPDGQTLVTGCDNHAVKYWDLTTGECVGTLAGYDAYVWSVQFRKDGQQIVTGSDDKTVRCWDVETGACVQNLVEHGKRVWLTTYSPDQQHIVSVSDDQTAKIWDSCNGQCVQTLQTYSNLMQSVAFHPNSQWVASSSEDRLIRLWDITTGNCVRLLSGHTNLIAAVTFSPDGTQLASASDDRTIRLWDVRSGECERVFQGHEGWVSSVAFSPDGRYLVSGGYDQTVHLWDCRSGERLRVFRGHSHRVKAIAIAPQGTLIASASDDHTIKLWDRETGDCLHTLEGHSDWVVGVAMHPLEEGLVSGSCDRTLRLWNMVTGECLCILEGHTERVRAVTFAPRGDVLASCGDDGTIRLWDWATGQCSGVLQGHTRTVWAVAFSADGEWLISCSEDETLRLWNWRSQTCITTLRPERPYEGMKITAVVGLTSIQKNILHSLGAIEENPFHD